MSPVLLLLTAFAFAGDDTDTDSGDTDSSTSHDDEVFGTSSHDADVFGSDASGPTEAPTAPPDPSLPSDTPPTKPSQDESLGVPIQRTTDADISRTLGEADQRLAIGGYLYLRADAALPEETDAKEATLTSPSLMDVYLDGRPNDRVRVYSRARLSRDFTVMKGDTDAYGNAKTATSVTLDQLWLKGDVARKVYFTVGQQRIKWGTGRFWNPTDFMNSQKLDPLAIFDVRTGVPLIKLDMPLEKYGANVYAIANFDGAQSPRDIGGALRAEIAFASTEVTASVAARRGTPLRIGGDVSTGIGPLDLHVEGAVEHGDTGPFYEGTLDLTTLTLPTEVDRSDEWIPQVVLGGEVAVKYSAQDSVYFGVEGFYNGRGYDDPGLYPWLFVNNAYVPFYLGREYGGVYAFLPSIGKHNDTSLTGSVLGNLSDQSYVGRLDYRVTALTYLSFNAYAQYHFGQDGEFHYTTDIPAIPGVDGLEDGIDVPAPMVDVGVGASLSF